MERAKRVSAHHVELILRRERELAPDLFRAHSAEEISAIEFELSRLDRLRAARHRAAIAPEQPQLQLAVTA